MRTEKATVVSVINNGRFNIKQPLVIKFENGKQFRADGVGGRKYTIGQAVTVQQDDLGIGWQVIGEQPKYLA